MCDNAKSQRCKICNSSELAVFAHTATCRNCGVLLCYPYPKSDTEVHRCGAGKDNGGDAKQRNNVRLQWHLKSGALNHHNFTNMSLFALSDADRPREMNILDYGGGGGQFALVMKSLFPLSEVYIVDIRDATLLDQYRPLNRQIEFDNFLSDATRFDVIFMNDVLEHVSDPLGVLNTLRRKLVDADSRIFVDTPCQFWLYPITKRLNKQLYTKVLRGTVDYDHRQIWSKSSFAYVAYRNIFGNFRIHSTAGILFGSHEDHQPCCSIDREMFLSYGAISSEEQDNGRS